MTVTKEEKILEKNIIFFDTMDEAVQSGPALVNGVNRVRKGKVNNLWETLLYYLK